MSESGEHYRGTSRRKKKNNKKQPELMLMPNEPVEIREARDLSADQIPPRPWVYDVALVRGFVSVLVAPGGTGKSLYAMTVAASIATGKPLLGEHVHKRTKVWLINLDDPLEELDRRFLALRMHYTLRCEDWKGWLFMESGDDRDLVIAEINPDDGFSVQHPDEDMLIAGILQNNIGVLIVDPFAESHSLEENSNPQMVQAAAAWRRIARVTNCAILLVHHVRKGAVVGDIDGARGAKALTDSCRVGLLMAPMTTDEAEQLGIDPEHRTSFVRLDSAKANLAPRAAQAKWFRLVRVKIGNGTPEYPNGDEVAVIEAWQPPSAFEGVDAVVIDRIFRQFEAGLGNGEYYCLAKQAKERWAGHVIVKETGRTERQASVILKEWTKNQVIGEEEYISPSRKGGVSKRVILDDKLASEMRRGSPP
jgi:hypothetical protein